MNKQELRKLSKAAKTALSEKECEFKSQKIHDLLFSRFMIHRFSPIHIYKTIILNKEVDTEPIFNTLLKDFSPDIYISKSLENGELLHSAFTRGMSLETNKWGINEPSSDSEFIDSKSFFEKYKEEDILVIIPLLAFDKSGHRLGYGRGYYDRFLQYSGENCTKIGLSMLDPVEIIEDSNMQDIKLNYCITPERVWTFKER